MKKRIRVPRRDRTSQPLTDFAQVPSASCVDYDEITISRANVADAIIEDVVAVRRQALKPAHLLLGWETWLQLGWQLGDYENVLYPREFRGLPIIVDDTVAQCVKVLVGIDDVTIGGR